MDVDLGYKIYRILLFILLFMIIVKIGFNDILTNMDQIKLAIVALISFLIVDRYYPSVTINAQSN